MLLLNISHFDIHYVGYEWSLLIKLHKETKLAKTYLSYHMTVNV